MRGSISAQRWSWCCLACAAAGRAENAKASGADLSPEETVRRYLAALKAGNFNDAYPLPVERDDAEQRT